VLGATCGCDALADRVRKKAAEKVAEEVVERGGGGSASVDLGRDVDVSDLDKAFRYPGAKATMRIAQNTPQGAGTVYAFETSDSVSKVVAFYEKAAKGYKQLTKMDAPTGTLIHFLGKGYQYTITVAAAGAKTTISVVRAKGS